MYEHGALLSENRALVLREQSTVLREPEHGSPRTRAHLSWRTGEHLSGNRRTSPCSPRAPNLFHVLPSRMVGWNDLCTHASLTTFGDILGTIRDLGYCFHFNSERFCILIGNRDCISVFLFFWRYEKTLEDILTGRKTCLEKKNGITQMWHGIDHNGRCEIKWTLAGVGAVHWKVQEWRRSAKHPTCSRFTPALPHPPSPVGSMKGKDCKKSAARGRKPL